MRLNSKALGIILVVSLFGGIAASAGMGYWHTISSRQPDRFQGGNADGKYDPVYIRGSYTFGEISQLFEVPLGDLTTAFGINDQENVADLQISILEKMYAGLVDDGEVGTGSVSLFVAWFNGLPYQPAGDEYLPSAAAHKLKTEAALTSEQIAYLESHTLAPDKIPAGVGGNLAEQGSREAQASKMLHGKTTFRDLLDWGLTEEQIEIALGMEMPQPLLLVRDFCADNGLSFGQVKEKLQILMTEN